MLKIVSSYGSDTCSQVR